MPEAATQSTRRDIDFCAFPPHPDLGDELSEAVIPNHLSNGVAGRQHEIRRVDFT
jgi:hypothetical protein